MGYRSVLESAELDALSHQIIHALQLDGRASFNRIATVLGVSEQTAARRYRRMRTDGVGHGVDKDLLGALLHQLRMRDERGHVERDGRRPGMDRVDHGAGEPRLPDRPAQCVL